MAVTIIPVEPAQADWAPSHYRTRTVVARDYLINTSNDVYIEVLVSILYFHPEWTRRQVAESLSRKIDIINAGGWGRTWTLTEAQLQNLQNSNIDFETAWRAIPSDTIGAYGV